MINQPLVNTLSECIGHCETDEQMQAVVGLMAKFAGLEKKHPVTIEHVIHSLYNAEQNEVGYNKIQLVSFYKRIMGTDIPTAKEAVEKIVLTIPRHVV